MIENPFIAKMINKMDQIMIINQNLDDAYSKFLEILAAEEKSIIDHDIQLYETHGKEKEQVAASILDNYQSLSSHCESIYEAALERHFKISTVEKLSNVVDVFHEIYDQLEAPETSKNILKLQISKVKSSIELLIKTQLDSKDLVERNVLLVERLIDNHRQSYQFWREAIAKETVGYNEKGRRSTSQSVSMFNARA